MNSLNDKVKSLVSKQEDLSNLKEMIHDQQLQIQKEHLPIELIGKEFINSKEGILEAFGTGVPKAYYYNYGGTTMRVTSISLSQVSKDMIHWLLVAQRVKQNGTLSPSQNVRLTYTQKLVDD